MDDGVVRAPRVRRGDRVRLVSPASRPESAWVDEQVAVLQSWGLVPEVGEHALDCSPGSRATRTGAGTCSTSWPIGLGDLGVPVLGGLPAGHGGVGADGGPDQVALALGAPATLDTASGTLTVGPCVR